MASIINADKGVVSGITGIVQTADNTGNLTLQANGVSVLTVNTSNAVAVTGAISATGNITGSYLLGNGSQLTGVSGGMSWNSSVQTANFTAAAGSGYFVNTTSSAIYGTLPASPALGQTVQFVDYAQTFGTNNFIINPNGGKINANTSNVSITSNSTSVGLVYSDSTRGWIAYDGFSVSPVGPYSVDYLVVAGGGGGAGGYASGGGGAGGFLTATTTFQPGISYTITVGAGGAGSPARTSTWLDGRAASGANSAINTVATAIGGGGGAGNAGGAGSNGGSGGGGGQAAAGGAGTAGQGNNGGSGGGSPNYGGGGGGGATGTGVNGSSTVGGNGGAGTASSISGISVTYAGGGGGGTYYPNSGGAGTAGSGGAGGGGAGGAGATTPNAGTAGTNNSGGGGGGGGGYDPGAVSAAGGAGGSGIVIIRYLGSQRGTGGTVTSSGGYTIHTFTASSTYTA
jgi:hypothetical protein